jgi:hypothetical protein
MLKGYNDSSDLGSVQLFLKESCADFVCLESFSCYRGGEVTEPSVPTMQGNRSIDDIPFSPANRDLSGNSHLFSKTLVWAAGPGISLLLYPEHRDAAIG